MAKSLSSFLSHFPEMLSFLNFSLIASFVLLLAKSDAVAAEKSPQFDVSICKINVADPPTTFNVWSLRSEYSCLQKYKLPNNSFLIKIKVIKIGSCIALFNKHRRIPCSLPSAVRCWTMMCAMDTRNIARPRVLV